MFCKGASASGASIRPDRNFPDSWRRPWRLCLWVYAVASTLFRSHMSASEGQDAVVVVVVRLSPKSCYTMSSCRLVWCGAVGRHLLRRSCKIPSSHGFVYARPFSYPGNVQKKKREPRNTQTVSKWQQRKCNYRKHIHHQPCPEPTVAFRCVRTRTEGMSVRQGLRPLEPCGQT